MKESTLYASKSLKSFPQFSHPLLIWSSERLHLPVSGKRPLMASKISELAKWGHQQNCNNNELFRRKENLTWKECSSDSEMRIGFCDADQCCSSHESPRAQSIPLELAGTCRVEGGLCTGALTLLFCKDWTEERKKEPETESQLPFGYSWGQE